MQPVSLSHYHCPAFKTSSYYTALDSGHKIIRLHYLSPDPHPDDNRLQFNLEIVELADAPVYEALSYT